MSMYCIDAVSPLLPGTLWSGDLSGNTRPVVTGHRHLALSKGLLLSLLSSSSSSHSLPSPPLVPSLSATHPAPLVLRPLLLYFKKSHVNISDVWMESMRNTSSCYESDKSKNKKPQWQIYCYHSCENPFSVQVSVCSAPGSMREACNLFLAVI